MVEGHSVLLNLLRRSGVLRRHTSRSVSAHRYPMRGHLPAPLHDVGDCMDNYGNCGRFQRVVGSLDERRKGC